MNPEIFIRTYAKDAEWLDWCLRSCLKNAPTLPITLVCPEEDREAIRLVSDKYDVLAQGVAPHHKDGYLDQQWSKLNADAFCRDADYIIHVDSDCIWTGLDWQEELFKEDKPVIIMTSYNSLKGSGAECWQEITEDALGWKPDYEFMRRHPSVYPRWLYTDVRAWLNKAHADEGGLWEWYKGIKNRRFSEFNVLGAVAWKYHREKFHWIDSDKDVLPEKVVEQGWSWGGFTDEAKKKWEELL